MCPRALLLSEETGVAEPLAWSTFLNVAQAAKEDVFMLLHFQLVISRVGAGNKFPHWGSSPSSPATEGKSSSFA